MRYLLAILSISFLAVTAHGQTASDEGVILDMQRAQESGSTDGEPASVAAPVQRGPRENLSAAQAATRQRFQEMGTRVSSFIRDLRTAIAEVPGLPTMSREQLVQQLTNDESSIQRATIDLSRSGTLDELREQVNRIKRFWTERAHRMRAIVGTLMMSRLQAAIDRFTSLTARVEELVVRLERQEYDTTELRSLQQEMVTHLDTARDHIELAREQFRIVTTGAETSNEAFQKAVEELRNAHQSLRQAHVTSRTIIQKLRAALPDVPDSTTTPTASEIVP